MSRVNKYRAWFVETQTMYSWEDLINRIGISESIFIETELWKPMQYTGLKDKNGAEIYDGDIAQYIYKGLSYVGIIIMRYGSWVLDHRMTNKEFNQGILHLYHHRDIVEVIGDIHQNPELLKK